MFKKFIFLLIISLCIPFSISEEDDNSDLYSTDNIIDLSKTNIYFDTNDYPDTKENLSIEVNDDDYVYKTGYYLDVKHNMWNPFIFEGNIYKNTDWIEGSASKRLTLERSDFGLIDFATTVTSYVAVFACSKQGSGWDCHDGKWVIKEFTATIVPDDCEEQNEGWLIEKCPVMMKASGENHIFELWAVGNSTSNGESKLFCEIRMDDGDFEYYYFGEQKTEDDVDVLVRQIEYTQNNSTRRCKIDVK